jgi:hypothetical protein
VKPPTPSVSPFIHGMVRTLAIAACLVVVNLAAADEPATKRPPGWAQPIELEGVQNLHKVSDTLYRSALRVGGKALGPLRMRRKS